MALKRKFPKPTGDGEIEAIEVDFEPVAEPWGEYKLADGGRFKMRLAVQRVFQVVDEEGRPAMTEDGDRYLVVQSQNQLIVQE